MTGVSTKILKDFDYKLINKLKSQLNQNNKVVKVGVPVSSGEEENGIPIVLVAAVHEFGSPKNNIPERSFIRSAVNENKDAYTRMNRISLAGMLKGVVTIETALGRLGELAKGHMQQKIRKGNFAPLQPATIKAKGSSAPLIDTGNLIQSITYEIGSKN